MATGGPTLAFCDDGGASGEGGVPPCDDGGVIFGDGGASGELTGHDWCYHLPLGATTVIFLGCLRCTLPIFLDTLVANINVKLLTNASIA
jgi:hypothetical protein